MKEHWGGGDREGNGDFDFLWLGTRKCGDAGQKRNQEWCQCAQGCWSEPRTWPVIHWWDIWASRDLVSATSRAAFSQNAWDQKCFRFWNTGHTSLIWKPKTQNVQSLKLFEGLIGAQLGKWGLKKSSLKAEQHEKWEWTRNAGFLVQQDFALVHWHSFYLLSAKTSRHTSARCHLALLAWNSLQWDPFWSWIM